MRKFSLGKQITAIVVAIFLAFALSFILYLHFDVELSKTLHDDYLFLCFSILLIGVLITSLLLYSRKIDSLIDKHSEEKNALSRKELTQNIAHELRTPLTSIRGYLETILDNPDLSEETLRMFHERSYAQTLRLTSLVGDLTTLNKLDEDPDGFPFEDVDLSSMIRTVLEETELSFKKKEMRVVTDMPDYITLTGNSSLLYSIFRNLTDNALFYAGDSSTVRIGCNEEKDCWSFRFEDNGPGVDKEHLSHIFERFYRVDKGRSRSIGGTGLGLAIVKNAVQIHGGRISAYTVSPHGLGFRFTLKKA